MTSNQGTHLRRVEPGRGAQDLLVDGDETDPSDNVLCQIVRRLLNARAPYGKAFTQVRALEIGSGN